MMPSQPISEEMPTITEAITEATRFARRIDSEGEHQPEHRVQRWALQAQVWSNLALAMSNVDVAGVLLTASGQESAFAPVDDDLPPLNVYVSTGAVNEPATELEKQDDEGETLPAVDDDEDDPEPNDISAARARKARKGDD